MNQQFALVFQYGAFAVAEVQTFHEGAASTTRMRIIPGTASQSPEASLQSASYLLPVGAGFVIPLLQVVL